MTGVRAVAPRPSRGGASDWSCRLNTDGKSAGSCCGLNSQGERNMVHKRFIIQRGHEHTRMNQSVSVTFVCFTPLVV